MIPQHRLLNEVSELVDAGVIRTTFAESLGAIDAANLEKAHAPDRSVDRAARSCSKDFVEIK